MSQVKKILWALLFVAILVMFAVDYYLSWRRHKEQINESAARARAAKEDKAIIKKLKEDGIQEPKEPIREGV